jgi:hypothetical protein
MPVASLYGKAERRRTGNGIRMKVCDAILERRIEQ